MGLLLIALKLLANDKGKFFTLILGITFAVFLIMQMTSAFTGAMRRSAANIINLGAKVWILDPSVNIQTDNIPLPDYILDAVKSLPGVKYAVPVYSGAGLVKLSDGRYQSISIIGLDDATLMGRPNVIEGNINDIFNDDAYIVIKDTEYDKLNSPKIGDLFEINDFRGVVVGIGKTPESTLFGLPTVYTTFTRAKTVLPTTRKTISYIIAEPKSDNDISLIKQNVKELGYVALTKNDFIKKNKNYYIFKTGFGTNILIMTVISFIIGLSIAGQTFYTFVLENLEEFGALKAIGAKKSEIIKMILFQSSIVGFLGYGFGIFISSVLIALAKIRLPSYASVITYELLVLSFCMVIIIIFFSSYLGIRRVIRIDPFEIFRG